jgi:hypothetical protein
VTTPDGTVATADVTAGHRVHVSHADPTEVREVFDVYAAPDGWTLITFTDGSRCDMPTADTFLFLASGWLARG